FAKQGFRILGIFDDDENKWGKSVDGVTIFPMRDLPRELKARNLQVAVVAVPGEAAQGGIDKLVAAGIKAGLNFAPGRTKVARDGRLKNVDLSMELERLSFYLAQGNR